MKKFLGFISLALICILILGCSSNNSAQVKLASQKLSSGLDKMISQVNKLEDIDNDKMELDSLLGDSYSNSYSQNYNNENDNLYQNEINTENTSLLGQRNKYHRYINPNYERSNMNVFVPTSNKMIKTTNVDLKLKSKQINSSNNLSFISSSQEEDYNNLYTLSNDCKNLSNEYRENVFV